jgi:hypothetical protein
VGETVYHVELRHFPRNVCRFNLSERELRATVLEPWAADRPFELGELKWDPRHARLTVLKGPHLPPEQLSMGRGWRAAQRQSRDVTERLLAGAVGAPAGGTGEAQGAPAPPGASGGAEVSVRAPGTSSASARAAAQGAAGGDATDLKADSLGLELLTQMGSEATPLRRVWDLAATRENGSASDALALAERAVASLLRARLVVLLRAAGSEGAPEPVGEQDMASVLLVPECWTGDRQAAQVWVRRA